MCCIMHCGAILIVRSKHTSSLGSRDIQVISRVPAHERPRTSELLAQKIVPVGTP